MGYIDLKQQETYEKLRNRGWYSKWYWYFNNVTTTNDNNNDGNTLASTVTATANSCNNCNNYNNNNVIIMKIIIAIKMKSGCALKWKKVKRSYIYIIPLISYSVKKMLLNSVFVVSSLSVVFKEFGKVFQIIGAI